jgi:hypothetical protein
VVNQVFSGIVLLIKLNERNIIFPVYKISRPDIIASTWCFVHGTVSSTNFTMYQVLVNHKYKRIELYILVNKKI